jgi:hypothetical protein
MPKAFKTTQTKYWIGFFICAGIALFIFSQHGENINVVDKNAGAAFFGIFALIIAFAIVKDSRVYLVTDSSLSIENIWGRQIDDIGYDEIQQLSTHHYSTTGVRRTGVQAAYTVLTINLKDGQVIEINMGDIIEDEAFVLALRAKLGEHIFN